MANVSIHGPTGVLVVDGQKVFPLGISDPPPVDGRAPSGEHAFQELANGGITMIRSGTPDWALASINHQIAAEQKLQDTAAAHGLQCWLRLGPIADLPGAAANQQLLQKIVTAFKDHPALCAYKGVDEPRNPFRGAKWIRPAGMVRAHDRIKALDPNHPLVSFRHRGARFHSSSRTGRHSISRASISSPSPTRLACTATTATRTSASSATWRTRWTRPAAESRSGSRCRSRGAAWRPRRRAPTSCRGSRRSCKSASWPTRRSCTTRAGSCSSAGT